MYNHSMTIKDAEARKAYAKAHYEANREKYREASQRYRKNRQQVIRDAKSVPCMDCKVQYPTYVMQFDHVRGEKQFNIGNGSGRSAQTTAQILDEIAKCEVVCANCHAERSHQRGYVYA